MHIAMRVCFKLNAGPLERFLKLEDLAKTYSQGSWSEFHNRASKTDGFYTALAFE